MIPGHINIVFGWAWICVGLILGLVMGMRAEGEQWLGGYNSLTRRYLRLGHIAFIALSIINILYGRELGCSGYPSLRYNPRLPVADFWSCRSSCHLCSRRFLQKGKILSTLAGYGGVSWNRYPGHRFDNLGTGVNREDSSNFSPKFPAWPEP